jgi:hypothetical protein
MRVRLSTRWLEEVGIDFTEAAAVGSGAATVEAIVADSTKAVVVWSAAAVVVAIVAVILVAAIAMDTAAGAAAIMASSIVGVMVADIPAIATQRNIAGDIMGLGTSIVTVGIVITMVAIGMPIHGGWV